MNRIFNHAIEAHGGRVTVSRPDDSFPTEHIRLSIASHSGIASVPLVPADAQALAEILLTESGAPEARNPAAPRDRTGAKEQLDQIEQICQQIEALVRQGVGIGGRMYEGGYGTDGIVFGLFKIHGLTSEIRQEAELVRKKSLT